ncbi:MAG: hypothetical protein GY856_05730 [bacterium]|nr:hypothetical protein [bacterium]
MVSEPRGRLARLLRRARVLDMKAMQTSIKGRSRRSLFRDLELLGYQTSYTHGGRYYTLADTPDFDEFGLWFYRDIGFSLAGTLKEAVALRVEEAPDGRTHGELRHLLRVRLHNTLLGLVRDGRIGRQDFEGVLLYVSAQPERAADQVQRRREADRVLAEVLRVLTAEQTIEVLLEALRGSAEIPAPALVAKRLAARGVGVERRHVQQVYEAHGLVPGKKTAPRT